MNVLRLSSERTHNLPGFVECEMWVCSLASRPGGWHAAFMQSRGTCRPQRQQGTDHSLSAGLILLRYSPVLYGLNKYNCRRKRMGWSSFCNCGQCPRQPEVHEKWFIQILFNGPGAASLLSFTAMVSEFHSLCAHLLTSPPANSAFLN